MSLQAQDKQPLYYAIQGFLFLLAWLMLACFITGKAYNTNSCGNTAYYLIRFYHVFLHGKLFTFFCLLLGLRLFISVENKQSLKGYFLHSALLIFGAIVFSTISSIGLVIIPLVIFKTLLRLLYNENDYLLIVIMGVLFPLMAVLSFYSKGFLLHAPFFSPLFNMPLKPETLQYILQVGVSPISLVQFVYGFIIIIFGFYIGRTRWIVEYNFHYNDLKKLFIYSLLLIVFWLLLNYFKVYTQITKWRLGEVFYILDALSINLILVFVYLFILIYLENFKWGKSLLKAIEVAGRMWYINLIALIIAVFGIRQLNPEIEFIQAVFGVLGIFILLTIITYSISKFFK